ncbi:MAG: DeoR/GlpR transcriptional regulator [Clostridia bacterium]|nr:DeoR/GlpR transcriptional regulator [Clostridia bacterium]
MAHKEREAAILSYLREHRHASVAELAHALYVSEPTVRRDLAALSAAGKLWRTHGGAAGRADRGENLPLSLREREHSDAKTAIGRKCLELIKDGDTVMVDSSSSALALLRVIGERSSIAVVTNSAKAALILAECRCKTFVTGGELAADTYAYVGSHAEEYVRRFNADVCFFSVRTLTRDGRLTDNAIAENGVRRAMMAASRRRVLMLDSQKLGEGCLETLCRLSDVDAVVSERDLSAVFPDHADKFL